MPGFSSIEIIIISIITLSSATVEQYIYTHIYLLKYGEKK